MAKIPTPRMPRPTAANIRKLHQEKLAALASAENQRQNRDYWKQKFDEQADVITELKRDLANAERKVTDLFGMIKRIRQFATNWGKEMPPMVTERKDYQKENVTFERHYGRLEAQLRSLEDSASSFTPAGMRDFVNRNHCNGSF